MMTMSHSQNGLFEAKNGSNLVCFSDGDDDTSGYAPPPGSLRPNELSDVEEKAHYLPIATFLKSNFGKKYSTHGYKSNLFLTFSSRLL